ncbi:hypothetical protein SKAU_G00084760 [Synaphobranchus kaupii]|uniref:Uncharacterized protein n=1 Tax=Synaphobranchus kaupii TaxID=118154 RepID=A0A9Q1J5X5_SYNKA|nr:hypothetical protein SKAU_G00084760 [Synaphobranchus kaupii]
MKKARPLAAHFFFSNNLRRRRRFPVPQPRAALAAQDHAVRKCGSTPRGAHLKKCAVARLSPPRSLSAELGEEGSIRPQIDTAHHRRHEKTPVSFDPEVTFWRAVLKPAQVVRPETPTPCR